ncbi:MAG: type IV pilus biogenesis/stability protein PilW [Hydrogenophaga sp.]|uniref:type IV pilus biogenesis/stability protein PilW n=1 Tax=Hydrogenophaga sp. TaxID=1904254 RepID=UPI003D9B8658
MTKTLRSVAATLTPDRWGRRLLLAAGGWAVVAGLSGCAGGAGAPSAAAASSEPVTESDEPEARKRARIRLELASNYFENGQTTVALDEIKQSLVADPSYPSAYVLRGLVYMRMNETGLAEDSFRRALQLNPRDADALHNYGWFACQQGRHVEAIGFFQRALASPVYGGQAKTLMAKGICQTRIGQFSEAEGSFSRSYELDAANPITGYNLASLLYRRGEYTRAQFYIRRLNNSELANAETLWLGIKVERRLNNTEATEQLAQQLSRRYPKSREWTAYQRGAFDE